MSNQFLPRGCLGLVLVACVAQTPHSAALLCAEPPERIELPKDDEPLGGEYQPLHISKDGEREFYGKWWKRGDVRELKVWETSRKSPFPRTHPFKTVVPNQGEILPLFGRLYPLTSSRIAASLTFVQLKDEVSLTAAMS